MDGDMSLVNIKNYGFVRLAAAVPLIKPADVTHNTKQICSLIAKAEREKVALVAFPELCLCGSVCGALVHNIHFLEKIELAVGEIKVFSEDKNISIIVGAPIAFKSGLYNCAIVIQRGNIKGIVPKVLQGDGFAGVNYSADKINYTSEVCAFSYNQVFHLSPASFDNEDLSKKSFKPCSNECDCSFVVRIGDPLQVAFSPYPEPSGGDFGELYNEIDIIFNIASSAENVLGTYQRRKNIVSLHSQSKNLAYVFCTSAFGEIAHNNVCAGEAFIYENSDLLAENKRYSTENSLVISDVDIEKLNALRRKSAAGRKFAASNYQELSGIHVSGKFNIANPTRDIYLPYNGLNTGDLDKKFYRIVSPCPFEDLLTENFDVAHLSKIEEVLEMQSQALLTRLVNINCQKVVIGVSGGLDSTLALLVCVKAFDKLTWDRQGIISITMPGPGTSSRTLSNSLKLMSLLGLSSREISIERALEQHLRDISHEFNSNDLTFENAQARERTQILMDIANKEKGIVVGTGDLSEIALGWMTYNGDQMSMFAINAGLPKGVIKRLVKHCSQDRDLLSSFLPPMSQENLHSSSEQLKVLSDILLNIVDSPISPELLSTGNASTLSSFSSSDCDLGQSSILSGKNEKRDLEQAIQKTEEILGPYELHDFFLYHFINYSYRPEKILFLATKAFREKGYERDFIKKCLKIFLKRFVTQQFKRRTMPEGVKIFPVSLFYPNDWAMASDLSPEIFDLK